MSRLQRNVAANLVGRFASTAASLLAVPVFLRMLGIKSYGILGFTMLVQTVLGVADLGLSTTINRELARLSMVPDGTTRARMVLRTLESVYAIIAVIAGLTAMLVARPVAEHWMSTSGPEVSEVVKAVRITGVIVALQLPTAFYQGGLNGLERQGLTNAILVSASMLRSLGGALVLWTVSPTIEALLLWQLLVAFAQLAVSYGALWHQIGGFRAPAKASWAYLQTVWRFTASTAGNGVMALALTQLDRVVLSGILSLEAFGYYTLAGTVSAGLWSIIVPLNTAVFPRFVALTEGNDHSRLFDLYHRAAQTLAVFVAPIGMLLTIFPERVLLLWTHNAVTAEHTAPILQLLVLGTTVAGMTSIPAYLQVASGGPQLVLRSNAAFAICLVPLLLYVAPRTGGIGAAAVWLTLTIAQLVVMVPLIHRGLRSRELGAWYGRDVLAPVAACLAVGLLGRGLLPQSLSAPAEAAALAAVWTTMSVAAVATMTHARASVRSGIGQLRAVLSV